MNRRLLTAASGVLFWILCASFAAAQDTSTAITLAAAGQAGQAPASPTPVVGVIRSATRTTLVIRAEDGHYELFLLDSNTTRPQQLPVGATVSVTSKTTLTLKPRAETGVVRQSLCHGRSMAVVVEKVR